MKSQRDWCGVIGWLLAASLVALQARFVHASEIPSGPSVSINRGETYVIKGLSPDSAPEVTPINNSHALIINKEPDGTILVLGAEAGSETVKIKTVDGKLETYTVTVKSNADPNNPLAPGSAPAAIGDSGSASVKPATTPLDAGAGPAAAPDSSTGASAPKSEAAAGGTPAT